MNQTEKRTIRSMLRKGMTITQIYNQTKFTVGQIMSAPFAWFTYFCGEITLYKTRDDFKAIQKQTIHALKDLRPIEELASISQLEINKYWQCHGFIGNALEDNATPFRLIDDPATIYHDLTDTDSIDPNQKDNPTPNQMRKMLAESPFPPMPTTFDLISNDIEILSETEHVNFLHQENVVFVDDNGNQYEYDGVCISEGKLKIAIKSNKPHGLKIKKRYVNSDGKLVTDLLPFNFETNEAIRKERELMPAENFLTRSEIDLYLNDGFTISTYQASYCKEGHDFSPIEQTK